MVKRIEFVGALVLLCAITVGCGVSNNTTGNTTGNASRLSPTNTVQSSAAQSSTTANSSSVSSISLGDNPPFYVRTSEFIVKPRSAWNATQVSGTTYHHVQVLDENGKTVTLDVSNGPLLFEAYWCPHCQRTLILLTQNQSDIKKKPILISTGFAPNTTIQQAVWISHQEFKTLKLYNFQVYYLLNQSLLAEYVTNYPTLVFEQNGHTERMSGEYILPLWERALS